MKQLCIFLSLMLGTLMSLTNCATKHKTKQIEQVRQNLDKSIVHDSMLKIQSTVSKIESNQTFNEFERIVKALNVQYDGEQDNTLKVSYNRTENGTELNVTGKGKASYNEQSEQSYNLTRNDIKNIFNSIIDTKLQQSENQQSKLLVNNFKSDTEKQKFDFSFLIYFLIGGVLCIGIILYKIKK